MLRRIIQIDEEKCNGCGACAAACHEGAIEMVNGKARLMRDDYCDGLGDCLPACPADAISFVEREARAYDEAAVRAAKAEKAAGGEKLACGCPGTAARAIPVCDAATPGAPVPGRLRQWPVQLKLAPVCAAHYRGAELLIAADCTAYAYGNFHEDFIRNRVTLIGCPKLDAVQYAEKLGAIFAGNDIAAVRVARMEVPCCGGLEHAVRTAIADSGKQISMHVSVIAVDGQILSEYTV